jgi:hypothetical protein
MRSFKFSAVLLLCLLLVGSACASFAAAYDAQPRVVVILVVDQLRADMLERHYREFRPDGFRLLLDRGAWFTNCYYEYANTETAPGHATIGSGAYTLGHGIIGNEWYDPHRQRFVSSVEDDATTNLGAPVAGFSASPRNLLTDTIGDELKLATGGRARVFGVALKDRAAVLPVGFAADAAYWIDQDSGAWITSSYYLPQAPAWVVAFNHSPAAAQYLNREWKDDAGKTLLSTASDGKRGSFFRAVGPTPFANDYTFDFVRALIENEHVGSGPATDLLSISLSAHDILGHRFGPDSPEERAMVLALDRELAGFFAYLAERFGAGNVVIALTADHGVAPLPAYARKLRVPAASFNAGDWAPQINAELSTRLARAGDTRPATVPYVLKVDYPRAFLNAEAFTQAGVKEADAERMVGEALVRRGARGYVTRAQLAAGEIPNSVFAGKYRNSYSPLPGWYVFVTPPPFVLGSPSGTGHGLPYAYDAHVPLAFYGPQFKPGVYRQPAEPVDLAVTLSSLLGINQPASATGRVLWESLAPATPAAPAKP